MLTIGRGQTFGSVTCRACSECKQKKYRFRSGSSYGTYTPKMLIMCGGQLKMQERAGPLTSWSSASFRAAGEARDGSMPEDSSITRLMAMRCECWVWQSTSQNDIRQRI